ncbi:sigma-70 family RNA polymerase sigma factor [Paenisporosarcina antarctica]|uniref:sigma-70 family RNA polymerase sigma factor n=1 Tax=Paenisporosarcina antarctica TaxID=417367 RepID=UPI001FB897AC|nr:sigma-70 family RNA polymerase sigma factor [Paenisporosarcina antarctica]
MEELFIVNADKTEFDAVINNLMTTHGQQVLQLVYAYVHNEAIAEDLTQEIFVKCFKALPTYKGQSSIKTWLWRIAINHTKDYLKSWYNQQVHTMDDLFLNSINSASDVEQIIMQQEEDVSLANTVMSLPIKYREVIYLFYFEELTIKEIAKVLRSNENTVKTRLRKGKAILKERLEGF